MQLNNSTNLIQAEAYYWKILELMDIAGIDLYWGKGVEIRIYV